MRPVVHVRVRPSLTVCLAVLALTGLPSPARAASVRQTRGEPAAVRDARAAQRSFEFARRSHLPFYDAQPADSRGHGANWCPVRIGRLCLWDTDDDGSSPPPEPASIATARTRLLEQLERAAAADSANEWVAGQRVRYALEARRPADALAIATACAASRLWCLSLRGVTYHLSNRAVAAAAAFDSADALRSLGERCAWNDLSPWLEPGVARAYHRLPCGSVERTRWEARFWRLAQPLWLLPVNDLRNEWHARRIMARIHGAGANPYGMTWGDDFDECELRYGWPTAWSTYESRTNAMAMYALAPDPGRYVSGWSASPSYDWVPRARALAVERRGVADLPDEAWALRAALGEDPAVSRYAPAYAGGGIGDPTRQIARFRHGDTAVVVGAYDATRDSLWSDGQTPPALTAALLVVDDSGEVAAADRRDSVARTGVLVARLPAVSPASRTARSDTHWLLGFEILQRDSVHTPDGRHVLGRALRARIPLHPLGADAPLSDLLVLRHSPGPTPSLADATDSAAGTLRVPRGGTIGLYWEQYGGSGVALPAQAPADTIVIAATRLTRSLRERIAGALGIGSVDRPIALRYPDPGGAGVGRAIGITWPDVPAGDYRLDVTLVPGAPGHAPATTSRVVHISED